MVQKSASCIVVMTNVLCTCNDLLCNRSEIFIFAHFPCFFRTLVAPCANLKAQVKKMVHNWRRQNVFLCCCIVWDPYFNCWMRNLLNKKLLNEKFTEWWITLLACHFFGQMLNSGKMTNRYGTNYASKEPALKVRARTRVWSLYFNHVKF